MKYKTELIHEILEQRGHEKSTLHYQSECVESWVDETKGAYPKLCDYEGEWLNYIAKNPIGYFPYVTFSGTNGVVENVVPYAYKSAILTGNTLVNLVTGGNEQKQVGKGGDTLAKYNFVSPLDHTKTYTLFFEVSDFVAEYNFIVSLTGGYNGSATINEDGTYKIRISPSSNNDGKMKSLWFYWEGTKWSDNNQAFINNIVLIEGDYTNVDIPYFEGMQSVIMPVLKTTGKNLFGGSLITTNDARRFELKGFELIEGEKYALSYNFSKDGAKTHQLQYMTNSTSNPTYLSSVTTNTSEFKLYFTVPKDLTRLFIYTNDWNSNLEHFSNIQIEQGSQATAYEPHKTNIVTVNEDVTLRSNGSVYDELDCLTGKLTQRIDENGEVLSQDIVKTVGLTITNQDGDVLNTLKPIEGTMYITTEGTPIKPIFECEVPVEAITQNLASFIEGE